MVTMSDIAAAAGVSQATVSYALRGDPSISEATRQRVLDMARKLNYTVNLAARAMRSGRNNAIGLVLQDLSNPYSTRMADAISSYAIERGLQTVIQQTMYQLDAEQHALQHVSTAFCDGVIFCPTKFTWPEIHKILDAKPVVLMVPEDEAPEADTLATPCGPSMFTATSYLISQGCRLPLFLGMEYTPYEQIAGTNDMALARVAGFERALIANGIEVTTDRFLNSQGWNPVRGRAAVHDLLAGGVKFDGLVCVNDDTAIGALRGLSDCGVRVPDDVQVIGFDGVPNGEHTFPALSTVAIDFEDLAHKAVDMLVSRIENPDLPARHQLVDTRLTIRESTR